MNIHVDKIILLVENDPIIADATANKIKQFGYHVSIVNSGEKAVQSVIENSDISLVLIDIELGNGIDGAESSRLILQKRQIPIVFLTDYTDEEYVNKINKIPHYGYIIKNSGDFVLKSSIKMAFDLFYEKHAKSEEALQSNLKYLESINKISATISQSVDVENMMEGIIKDVFEIFKSDRVWLIYPINPDYPTFRVPYEYTNPQYPGGGTANIDIPLKEDSKKIMADILASTDPITYDIDKIDKDTVTQFSVKAQIVIGIHPKIGDIWGFGMHQCSYERIWTAEEQKLFKDIALRITDALSNLLFFQNLRKSEFDLLMSQKKLQSERDRVQLYFDTAAVLMVVLNEKGVIVQLNKKGHEILEYEEGELTGCDWFKTCLPDYKRDSIYQVFSQLIMGMLENSDVYDNIILTKNGNEKIIRWHNAILRNTDNIIIGVLSSGSDITERVQMEEQLRHSDKMKAIGQLAGGVAHDFNNMLAVIMSAADLLKMKNRDFDEKSLELVNVVIKSAKQAASLTSKLLTFGRKSKIAPRVMDLHSSLDDALSILNSTIDKKITIELRKEATNHTIIGDNSALQNALMNLGINASHAIFNSGKIEIRTRNIELDKTYCTASPFNINPGEFIEIEIRDTGSGIAHQNLNKIFEPFFTTKEQGKGTGLGLSAVYGTIQEHKGAITVYSEIGTGTVFHIYIPCSETKIEKIKSKPEIITGSGHILLVDDEDMIRITGRDMLEEIGYKVTVAENGLEAIKIFKKLHSEIDAVIMDMIMPEMNGHEAFLKMKDIDKDCTVAIASGFTKDENLTELKKAGLRGFIQKPFCITELSVIVEEILSKNK